MNGLSPDEQAKRQALMEKYRQDDERERQQIRNRTTQRTIRELKNMGRRCGIVERFNTHVGPHGIRQDLFGIIDVIALDPESGVVGIKCCAGSGFSAHLKKLCEENAKATKDWLETPGTGLEIWAWRKVKKYAAVKP